MRKTVRREPEVSEWTSENCRKMNKRDTVNAVKTKEYKECRKLTNYHIFIFQELGSQPPAIGIDS